MVRAIYIGIDPRLAGAAGYSVLAHLEDPGGARRRGDRRRSGDRRHVSDGVVRVGWRQRVANGATAHAAQPRLVTRGCFFAAAFGGAAFFAPALAASAAVLMSSISLVTRAALLPRSPSK